MLLLLSFSTKDENISIVRKIASYENAVEIFHQYLIDRVCELKGVDRATAEDIVDEDHGIFYTVHDGLSGAKITIDGFDECVTEWLQVVDHNVFLL